MNKRQKEVAQYQLDEEKKVLKQLEKQYKTALDDINQKIAILQSDELTQSRIYRLEHQMALKAQVQAVLDKLHSDEYGTISQFLTNTYGDAWVGTTYDLFGWGVPLIMPVDPAEAVRAIQTDSQINGTLYEALGVDAKKLKKSISAEITRGLAGGMSANEIARNITNTTKAPLARAKTIVRTESHRIQQASCYNAQKTAKSKGADVVKQWDSTLDGDTRPTHRQLDGQIRELDEPFEMDGKSAMYPGDFGDPAEDCNCRCQSLQRAKWALDESELQTLKERAEFFGLDKAENFEDFRKKYLDAVEISQSSDKIVSDIASELGVSTDAIRIAALPIESQQLVYDAVHMAVGKFPQLKGHTQSIVYDETIKAVAQSRSLTGQLAVGSAFMDVEKLKKDYAYGVKLGFNPKGTDYRSILVHEFGHQLDGLLTKNKIHGGDVSRYGVIRTSKQVRKDVLAELGLTDERLREIRKEYREQGYSGEKLNHAVSFERREFISNHVSDYANENENEFFAECFSEYMTSNKPREAASVFGKILERLIGGLK